MVLLSALGTVTLIRVAPGYFTDPREMESEYAGGARASLTLQQAEEGSVWMLTKDLLAGWVHGDLGRSRQYDVPVTNLLASRARITSKLLVCGLALGWLLALLLAVLLSGRRADTGELAISGVAALLLAVPIGAMATVCLLSDFGGPLFVIALLIGVRDFKAMYHLLRHTWRAPHLLYARSLGMSSRRIAWVHLFPTLRTELMALGVTSIIIALSAIVPVEVIFDQPGLGQLAWSAAMNRDLPVLLALTLMVAVCIGIAGLVAPRRLSPELAPCG